MKINYLIISLTIIIISSSHNCFSQSVGFGAKGGLNLSTIGRDSQDAVIRPSMHIGILYSIELDYWLHVQPELIFSSEGAKSDNSTLFVRYSYINLPIIFKIYAFSDVFHFQLGPQLSYNVGGKLIDTPNDIAMDIKDNLKDVVLALGVGMGIDLKDGPSISLRYNIGLTSNVENSQNGSFTNNVFQISIGAIFSRN